jgi:hypothetical protein
VRILFLFILTTNVLALEFYPFPNGFEELGLANSGSSNLGSIGNVTTNPSGLVFSEQKSPHSYGSTLFNKYSGTKTTSEVSSMTGFIGNLHKASKNSTYAYFYSSPYKLEVSINDSFDYLKIVNNYQIVGLSYAKRIQKKKSIGATFTLGQNKSSVIAVSLPDDPATSSNIAIEGNNSFNFAQLIVGFSNKINKRQNVSLTLYTPKLIFNKLYNETVIINSAPPSSTQTVLKNTKFSEEDNPLSLRAGFADINKKRSIFLDLTLFFRGHSNNYSHENDKYYKYKESWLINAGMKIKMKEKLELLIGMYSKQKRKEIIHKYHTTEMTGITLGMIIKNKNSLTIIAPYKIFFGNTINNTYGVSIAQQFKI